MIKLCIFDMDGLLLDTERQMWTPSMNIAAQNQGVVISDEFHRSFMGMTKKDTSDILVAKFGNNFDPEQFYIDMIKNNEKIIETTGVPLKKGAIELLEYLKSIGIKTCVGTSTYRPVAEKELAIDNVRKYFDDVVCGDEIKNGKPDPEIYNKCFSKFNVDKSEVLVFEDAEAGGLAAIAAGMRLVLVPDLACLSDEIKNKAFKVIDDLSEIISVIKEENERTSSI